MLRVAGEIRKSQSCQPCQESNKDALSINAVDGSTQPSWELHSTPHLKQPVISTLSSQRHHDIPVAMPTTRTPVTLLPRPNFLTTPKAKYPLHPLLIIHHHAVCTTCNLAFITRPHAQLTQTPFTSLAQCTDHALLAIVTSLRHGMRSITLARGLDSHFPPA